MEYKKCGNHTYIEWCKSCQIGHLRENFKSWTSGNGKVDNLIQEMQLKINLSYNIIFEWIQYSKLDDFKGNGELCLAIWKDGPLYYESDKKEYTRNQNTNVALKYIYNFQNIAIEIKSYSINRFDTNKIFGISQNPDTNDFIFVLDDVYCIKCNKKYEIIHRKWCSTCKIQYSRDATIDNIIQTIQFKIDSYGIFEWIPYNQFDYIKEMDKDDPVKVYSALWKKGLLHYDNNRNKYIRIRNEKVILKYIYGGSQNIINEFNEVKNHSDCKVYGISQNPDTKDYILIAGHCEKCGQYKYGKLCKLCQINYVEKNFTDCANENEKIDNLIQKIQSKNHSHDGIVFEWIPYNQFNNIKEMVVYDFTKIYLAVWENGPSYHNSKDKYIRNKNRNKKVKLKSLCNLQNITDEFLNVDKSYTDCILYGISQAPGTKDYIVIFQDEYCEKCNKKYTNEYIKLCTICKYSQYIYSLFSGSEKIDELIQEMQLKINSHNDIVFEWIPYNQLDDIKKIGEGDFAAEVYSAIWKNGLLYYDYSIHDYKRTQNNKVTLKYLYNSQNVTNVFINKIKAYPIYGISQHPETKDYVIVYQYSEEKCTITMDKKILTNWTSGNDKIDKLIQKMQLRINSNDDIVFESVPYSQFNNIKEIGQGGFAKVYSAIWKNGEFMNEVKNYSYYNIYGISKNLDTKDYIIVFQNIYCEKCDKKYANINIKLCLTCQYISGNEVIDKLIQEMQLKVKSYNDIIFEWVPYSQFDNIEKICEGDFAAEIHSAIWKNGPLNYDNFIKEYIRTRNKEVTLKYLYNTQDITNVFINKIKEYPIYGISQHPDTKDYVVVLQYNGEQCTITMDKKILTNWTSGNNSIDELIQEMQLKVNSHNNIIFEWVPYSQFDNIKKIREGDFAAEIHSAIWKNGPLNYDNFYQEYTRTRNKEVTLKYLYNTRDITNVFINKIKEYPIYGISQHPDTKDYVVVLQYNGEKCTITMDKKILTNWTSGNDNIDELIQEMQSRINSNDDIVFESVPYNQFDNIKEIGQGGFAKVYSAIWKNGPLYYNSSNEYIRIQNKKVALKCLHNSQNISNKFLNEVKAYSIKKYDNYAGNNVLKIYGISQDPNTKDYIMILDYAKGGNFNHWANKNYRNFNCSEVLKGKPYTQAADIYSFGMIMYFVGTGKQPFSDCAHDKILALKICNGIRPEINEPEAPKCFIDLMKKCWDSNPDNRPKITEILELIDLYFCSYKYDKFAFKRIVKIKKEQQHYEVEKQFKKTEEYRKSHLTPFDENKRLTTHPQAFYTSRLLNPFTEDLPKDDNIGNNSVEVFDFTNDG
ncbi:unnamed protein product [Rhizophagus irregularis]|nr:unnamed protein product [Rhizophagus irregularis]